MFGPPLRQKYDVDKKRSIKTQSKSDISLRSTNNNVAPASSNKTKLERKTINDNDKKLDEKTDEDESSSSSPSPPPPGAAAPNQSQCKNNTSKTIKRTRDKPDKLKMNGNNDPPVKDIKFKSTIKATCSDNSKIFIEIENLITNDKQGKKKRMEGLPLNKEKRHTKSRIVDFKGPSMCEKQKKVLFKNNEHVKKIVLPFNKTIAASKGFKNRSKNQPSALWGNGKDWQAPVKREGNWERIYPLNNFNNFNQTYEEDYLGNKFAIGDKQIKFVVHHITNFIKYSKQIYYKDIDASEEELNAQLMSHMGMSGNVWLPNK